MNGAETTAEVTKHRMSCLLTGGCDTRGEKIQRLEMRTYLCSDVVGLRHHQPTRPDKPNTDGLGGVYLFLCHRNNACSSAAEYQVKPVLNKNEPFLKTCLCDLLDYCNHDCLTLNGH